MPTPLASPLVAVDANVLMDLGEGSEPVMDALATILSLKSIAARVGLGSSKSANAKLHAWMQANGKLAGGDAETKLPKTSTRKTNQTLA